MRPFLCCLLGLFTSTSFAPTSQELRSRYGAPNAAHYDAKGFRDSESYSVQPGLSLTALYGPDHRACQLEMVPILDLEMSIQSLYISDKTVSDVLEEFASVNARGKEFGEGTKRSVDDMLQSVIFTEYENVLIKQTRILWGVLSVTISFKRAGCPKPNNPFVFLPPPDAKTILALTPSSEELHQRYGVPGWEFRNPSDTPHAEYFKVPPDITFLVQYGADHKACRIEMKPADLLKPYISTVQLSDLIDALAPAAMRGKLVQGISWKGGTSSAYENVLIERYRYYGVAAGHPDTERSASIKFKRDVCPNPYTPVAVSTSTPE